MILKFCNRIISENNTIPILNFHRVLKEKDHIRSDDIVECDFERLIKALVNVFQVLPLDESILLLRENKLKKNAIAITFDDGYLDNYSIAFPILKKYGVTATFFIASGFLDGGWMWNDGVIEAISKTNKEEIEWPELGVRSISLKTSEGKKQAVKIVINKLKYLEPGMRLNHVYKLLEELSVESPKQLMMSSDDLVKLKNNGMDIGGHTLTHPILTSIKPNEARIEIKENKKQLEQICGKKISLFAYPNGKPEFDYNETHIQIIKDAGYHGAVTTSWNIARAQCDLYQLPRISPWDEDPVRYILRIFKEKIFSRFK